MFACNMYVSYSKKHVVLGFSFSPSSRRRLKFFPLPAWKINIMRDPDGSLKYSL